MSEDLVSILQGAGLAGAAFAAAQDVKARIIPNPLVLWVAATGLGAQLLLGGWSGWLGLGAAVAVFLPLGLLAGRGIIGGGDAKMIAASTLLFAPARIPELMLATALAGGLLALIYLAARPLVAAKAEALAGVEGGRPSLGPIGDDLRRVAGGAPLPYGVAIFAACAFLLIREAL